MEGLLLMAVLTAIALLVERGRAALRSQPLAVVHDEHLGELRFDRDDGAWRARVACPGGPLGFLIAGDRTPDAALLTHATDLVVASESFIATVRAFLDEEARLDAGRSQEIRGLQLEDVCLLWPKRPNDGMLYFASPRNDGKVWRCDYVDRTPRSLGFDS